MTENAVVRARIDERTKKEAAAVLSKVGLTISDAFRMLLVRVAAEKRLPFEPLVPNEETIAAMREARGGKLPRFKDVDALMKDLNAGD
ncbi:MAG: type II toxin-antitoxin system RelB/DinJ family antitoxin [Acetobacteraceae bacterium]